MLSAPPRKSYHKVWAGPSKDRTGEEMRVLLPPFPLPREKRSMTEKGLTRREFLAVCAVVVATGLVGLSCDVPGPYVYRLSLRGRRGSNAARKHNANKVFATEAAANQNRAHPGDRSRIVRVRVSNETFNRFFDGGSRLVVDLRSL